MSSDVPTPINAPICALAECPVWSPSEQALYFTDIFDGRLYRYDPDRDATTAFYEGEQQVGGFAFTPAGDALLCTDRGVFRLPASGPRALTPLAEISMADDERFNDVTTDPRGRLFAGTLTSRRTDGVLYRLERGRDPVAVLTGLQTSNGMAFSMDLRRFYHVDSGPRTITGYDYDADSGAIARPSVIYQGPAELGSPDGLTVDTEDMLWLACFRGGCVLRIDPRDGRVLRHIEIPARQVTSVMFGGPQLNELYITTAAAGADDPATGRNRDGVLVGGPTYRLVTDCTGREEFPADF